MCQVCIIDLCNCADKRYVAWRDADRTVPASLGDSQRCVETALSELTSTTRPSVTSSLATAMLGLHSLAQS